MLLNNHILQSTPSWPHDFRRTGISKTVSPELAREFATCDRDSLADLGLERSADGGLLWTKPDELPREGELPSIEESKEQATSSRINRIDRVIAAIVIVVLGLAILDWNQMMSAVRFTVGSLVDVAPYLAVSAVFVAVLAATGAEKLVQRLFSGHQYQAIVLASLLGAALPMCSTTVVPLIAALLVARVPLAPIVAFWIASPLMDPENFVMTVGVLGLPWAVARLLAAILLGIGAGLVTMAIPQYWFRDPIASGSANLGQNPWAIQSCGGESGDINWRFWTEADRRARFLRQGIALACFLAKWLALAFLLEALLITYVPAEAVLNIVGRDAWWAIPASAVVGIPVYLNGFAALPLVEGLLTKGMMPGAALAFLIAGEIMSLPTAIAVFAVVRKGIFAWYVLLGVSGAIVAGITLQALEIPLGH